MLIWPNFPPEERDHVQLIDIQLSLLRYHASTFRDAVTLIEHCHHLRHRKDLDDFSREEMEERGQYANWQVLSARDAVFSVYHFQSSLRSVRDQLKHTPTLKADVDTNALEAAYSRIDEEFPTWKDMRHAVAHWADQIFSNEQKRKHWPDGRPMILNSYNADNRRLIMTRDKRQLFLDVTNENLKRIESIMAEAWAAFRKAVVQFPGD